MNIQEKLLLVMDPDPLGVWIFEAGSEFIQVTNHGNGLREEFDIEVSNLGVTGELYGWEEPWTLVATVYNRDALFVIVSAYIERKGDKR